MDMSALRTELRAAGSALVRELDTRRPPGLRLQGAGVHVEKADTRGYCTKIASFGRSLDVELWFDWYLRRSEPFFWFGFAASRIGPIQALIKSCPPRLKPQVFLEDANVSIDVDKQFLLKKPLSDVELRYVVKEEYRRWKACFLGKFDRAYSPSKQGSRLDVSRAASYLYEVSTAFTAGRKFDEGACGQITRNSYERRAGARQACLAIHGYRCKVCKMSFEEVYGPELGRHFIHVHHIESLSERGGSSVTKADKDLVPVCPNCHHMIHRNTPPIGYKALQRIFERQRMKRKPL
jgi:5-methylcytosine-specific restriction endonuclease McrA